MTAWESAGLGTALDQNDKITSNLIQNTVRKASDEQKVALAHDVKTQVLDPLINKLDGLIDHDASEPEVSLQKLFDSRDAQNVANHLKQQGLISEGMTDQQKVALVAKFFATNSTYQAEKKDVWNHADQTIAGSAAQGFQFKGDCDDLAIAQAAVLNHLGVEAQVTGLWNEKDQTGHMVVVAGSQIIDPTVDRNQDGKLEVLVMNQNELQSAYLGSEQVLTFGPQAVEFHMDQLPAAFETASLSHAKNVGTQVFSRVTQIQNKMKDLAKNLGNYGGDNLEAMMMDVQLQLASLQAEGGLLAKVATDAVQVYKSVLDKVANA